MNKKQQEILINALLEVQKIGYNLGDMNKKQYKIICDILDKIKFKEYQNGDTDGSYLVFDFDSDSEHNIEIVFQSSTNDGFNDEKINEAWIDISELQTQSISEAIESILKIEIKTYVVALLNTSILTNEGTYSLKDISLQEAIEITNNDSNVLDSAIGHQSTAEIMSTLLNVNVEVNRQMFVQEIKQQAVVFKLNGRPEEGRILSKEEIEKIGYKFQLLTRLS